MVKGKHVQAKQEQEQEESSDFESKVRVPRSDKSKQKKALNSWATALVEFNKGKPIFTIPKKGSDAYHEVKALMK